MRAVSRLISTPLDVVTEIHGEWVQRLALLLLNRKRNRRDRILPRHSKRALVPASRCHRGQCRRIFSPRTPNAVIRL